MDFTYYADLNPRYGARYQRRYAVFLRKSATETSQTYLHYATMKAAENAAKRLNEQEADHEMTNHPNRKQVKLSLSMGELEALVDILKWAGRQGYHPLSDYARTHRSGDASPALAAKVDAAWTSVQVATWRAVQS